MEGNKSCIKRNDQSTGKRAELKQEVIKEYGGACNVCGATDHEFLCVDHIYNDGKEERKEKGTGDKFYRWLKDNNFPKDRYQLLCFNCNHLKALSKEYSPIKIDPEIGETRRCNKCHEFKDLSKFYYRADRNKYLNTCKECYQKSSYDKKLRLEVINHYSVGTNRCRCCGETNVDVLCINHLKGNGNEHRLEATGDPKGRHFYRWLKKNNFPDGFNVLCRNCNCSTGHYGYCPHETATGLITARLDRHLSCLNNLRSESYLSQIIFLYEAITDVLACGGKIMLCGAGGSLHDHFASELVNRFSKAREHPLEALDLSGNTCLISAISNDYGYEYIFSKQIISMGKPEDLLICISTSGKTEAVLRAIHAARVKGITSVLISGNFCEIPATQSGLITRPDLHFKIPDSDTGLIQEMILSIIHILCHLLDISSLD